MSSISTHVSPTSTTITATQTPIIPGGYSCTLPIPIEDRINDISRRLRGMCGRFSVPDMDTDDLFQSCIAHILEREDQYIDQRDEYILTACRWHLMHLLEASKVYLRWVDCEGTVNNGDDDESEESTFDRIPSSSDFRPVEKKSEQAELAEDMLAIIKTLDPKNQQIIKLIFVGYKNSEIAEMLDISRPAVTQRLNSIREKLGSMIE